MQNTTVPQPLGRRQFASDNYAGMCPEAAEAMMRANVGHALPYGEDEWTRRACDLIREVFETDCEVFFTATGTAANSLGLASMCEPYQSILCHECAHVETDECGAPEFFSNGSKVLLVKGDNGKVDLDAVAEMVHRRQDIHYPRPRVLSLTETTELGTVYSVEEVRAAGRRARELGLRVHMDGARLANALVALEVAPKEITWQAGVDVLSLGGGKNGMGIGEAVVFFNKALATDFDYRCKQAGQLCSKMRFIAAPWIGVLENGAWLRYAERANAAAARLAAAITKAGLPLMFPRQANSVFVQFPPGMVEKLRERGWRFYTFIGCGGARFMCGWDTTTEDVDALAGDLCSLLSQR